MRSCGRSNTAWFRRSAHWRKISAFGLVATAGILLSEIGLRTPELVIGRLLGIEAVGIYSRADGLIDMFNRMVLNGVARLPSPPSRCSTARVVP